MLRKIILKIKKWAWDDVLHPKEFKSTVVLFLIVFFSFSLLFIIKFRVSLWYKFVQLFDG